MIKAPRMSSDKIIKKQAMKGSGVMLLHEPPRFLLLLHSVVVDMQDFPDCWDG